MKKNNKLLIVASFPLKKRKVIGGIEKSSRILINSKYLDEFDIIKFDTSQISNPPPGILIRSVLALIRLFKYIFILLTKRPRYVLVFCSDGASAIEKGIMILFSKSLGINSLIFPRAGNLMNQTKKNLLFYSVIKSLFKKSDYFLCQGKAWENYALNDLNINKGKVRIINNWTATKELIKIGEKRIVNKKMSNLNIVYTGWLEKSKGIVELVKVFSELKKKYNVNLYLVGDGKLRKQIELFIAKNNLESCIHLLGWLDDSGIRQNLKKADIFVLPSKNEGMSNSLIEAIAAGVPSICTSVGTISNFIKNRENGILIKPNNDLLLKENIEMMITDLTLRRKISRNGVISAKKNFSEENSIKKLANIIRNMD